MNTGNYTTGREIGKGGMATVYLARHDLLNRQVALKIMDPILGQQKGFLDKFLDEGRIVASLEHPHIVKIYDVGISEDRSTVYMAMEYLAGGSLKERLQETGMLSLSETLKVTEQIGSGLELAHQKGFIHRDIKPGNILFRQNGSAVLTDFGIAKLQDSMGDLTRMGYTLGTARYMSPEQASSIQLDQRSDIYSLGLVFYEMLTGKAAVAAEGTLQAIHGHVNLPPPILPEKYNNLQPVLDKVLAKSPDDRYASVGAFIEAVHTAGGDETRILATTAAIGGASVAAAPIPVPVTTESIQLVDTSEGNPGKKPLWISILVGVLLVALAGAGLWFWGGSTPDSNQLVNNATQPTTPTITSGEVSSTGNPDRSDNGALGDNLDVGGGSVVNSKPVREKVNLVFDASGSMWGPLEQDVRKIEVAKEVLGNMIGDWDGSRDIGLLAYGHNRRGDCDDIEQLIPVGRVDKQLFRQQVNAINPKGKTPIARALKKAAEALKYQEDPATVILISDGEESCDADPCGVAKELEQAGINFTAHVIGFSIDNDETRKQLQCIAEATGGTYESARDREELKKALAEQLAQSPPAQNVPSTESKPTVTPDPPTIPQGKLRLISLAAATGKPLKADIYIYQLEKQSARPAPETWWGILGIPEAWAAVQGQLIASKTGVTEAIFTLPTGRYQVEAKAKGSIDKVFEVEIVADKLLSRRVNLERQPQSEPPVITKPEQESQPEPPVVTETGTLDVSAFDAKSGEPLHVSFYVQTIRGKEIYKKHWVTSSVIKLEPGVYQVTARTKYGSDSKKLKIVVAKTIWQRFTIKKPEPVSDPVKPPPNPPTNGESESPPPVIDPLRLPESVKPPATELAPIRPPVSVDQVKPEKPQNSKEVKPNKFEKPPVLFNPETEKPDSQLKPDKNSAAQFWLNKLEVPKDMQKLK